MTNLFLYGLHGAIVGILVSVPLGPIGLITLDNTIFHGLRAGFITAYTVAVIDIVGTVLTLFSTISFSVFQHVPHSIKSVGAVVVCTYGFLLLVQKKKIIDPTYTYPARRTLLESLTVILSNPATYLSFGIVNILLNSFHAYTPSIRIATILGFIIATLGWWTILVLAAEGLKSRLLKHGHILHKIIGISIILSGISLVFLPVHLAANLRHIFYK